MVLVVISQNGGDVLWNGMVSCITLLPRRRVTVIVAVWAHSPFAEICFHDSSHIEHVKVSKMLGLW